MLIVICPQCQKENTGAATSDFLIGSHQVVVKKGCSPKCSGCGAVFNVGEKLDYRVEKTQ
jgi:hypothetical protein